MGKGMTVTGAGRAAGPRDECSVTVGAEVRAGSAAEALARSSESLERMRSALLQGGIPATALATSAVSLNPVYEEYPTVAGFSAAVQLTATTRQLGTVGELLAAVVTAGGDTARLHDVTYRHSDATALAEAAREAAWADALARATQLATLAGRTLGDVLSVVESGPSGGGGGPRLAMEMASKAGPTLDAGEAYVTVALTVRWSLR